MSDRKMMLFLLATTTLCTLLLSGANLAYVRAAAIFEWRLRQDILALYGVPEAEATAEGAFEEHFDVREVGDRAAGLPGVHQVEHGVFRLALGRRVDVALLAQDPGVERGMRAAHDDLQVNQGSLYPALHKLTSEGWIKSYWDLTENNRKAKYYRLTKAGTKQLRVEAKHWDRLATAVSRIMATG